MRFSSFIIKNLMRRKFRSLLTALGVAIAIAAVVALLGLSSGLRRTAAERFESRGVDLVVLRAGVAQRLNSSLNQSIGDRLSRLKHVKAVAPSLTDMVSFDDTSFIGVPVHGWPADSFAFSNFHVIDGRQIQADDTGKVMLGDKLASELKKKVGETLDIEGTPFEVIAVYDSSNMFDKTSAVVPIADLQKLMDRPEQVSEFQIAVTSPTEQRSDAIDELRQEIQALKDGDGSLLGLEALPTEEYINSNTEIKLVDAMAWMTSAIALVIGSVGMLNTMVMSVLERTQEIGILRAIGWRRGRIVRMILCESFLLSLIGAFAGAAFAVLLTRTLAQYPPVQNFIRTDLSLPIIGAGFLLAGVVALVGGAYPAIRGANLPPTEALRYE